MGGKHDPMVGLTTISTDLSDSKPAWETSVADPPETSAQMRLDKWLWAARFYKTRSLAAAAIDGGRVQVEGNRVKRARMIGAGDAIRIRIGATEWQVVVQSLAARRGPASAASKLYEETPESRTTRLQRQAELRIAEAHSRRDQGRPSKKQRRELLRLRRR